MDECVFHFDLENELNNNSILIPIAPLKQKCPLLESIDGMKIFQSPAKCREPMKQSTSRRDVTCECWAVSPVGDISHLL